MTNLLGATLEELTHILQNDYGKGVYHARAIFREVQRFGNFAYSQAPEFANSPGLAAQLARTLPFRIDPVTARYHWQGLVKFITTLRDGHRIESVILPKMSRQTLCISTQVGCRMGCRFCTTAKMGFFRHLTAAEMVGQYHNARSLVSAPIRNIVFMGMGEPLDNFEQVAKTVAIITDPRGAGVVKRHITLSTVGLAEGLAKLIAWNQPRINLAISLNASNDITRSRIMPVNSRLPMAALRDMLQKVPLRKKGWLMIEYILFKGFNDTEDNARELTRYLAPLEVKVNLLPYNASAGDGFKATNEENIHRFRNMLISQGVFTSIRSPMGRKLRAACGQLGSFLPYPAKDDDAFAASEPLA
jgi:23S rRNA (adenine2503-C2)-methyltransferase